ncbi:MAG: flippase-like domain-containing protein [Deltaproteobacteria bacterium]|nr:MAG: flippase-like domain-containing protein [Deltaproteobacteria bacterium]
MSERLRRVRRFLPIAVSVAALAVLFTQIPLARVLRALSWDVALWLLPALLLYGAVSLAVEALSLARLVPEAGGRLPVARAARIKAATYLLGIAQYALGLGALAVLLRRRAGVSLGDGAGVALLITSVDLLILLGLSSLGALALGAQAAEVKAGVVVAAGVGFAAGFALLRLPGSLGPVDRIRELSVFRALRVARPATLARLLVLRLVFVLSFITLTGVALHAFGATLPVGDLFVGVAVVALVASLPIAVAGIGTSQVAFVFIFRHHADEATLLACNLVLSAGLILLRVGLGLLFAGEFASEASEAAQTVERGEA